MGFFKHNILKLLFKEIHKFKKKTKMKAMVNNQTLNKQVMKEMERIIYLLFFNLPETGHSQVQATLDPRGALLSQIHQQAANQPLIE